MPLWVESAVQMAVAAGCEVYRDEPMSKHTTFKIGGPADLFILPKSLDGISKVIRYCTENSIPCHIIGKGSNLLVQDCGIRGVVLALSSAFASIKPIDTTSFFCTSGVSLAAACQYAYENGLTGLEFAYGIPGSIGGAVYMNAGAYDGEMKDVVTHCTHMDPNGISAVYTLKQLDFSYRHSIYSDNNLCITGVGISLQPGDKQKIRERMDELLARRCCKQPLEYPSAGSTFKRPKNNYASALIEECGLKGYTVGGAQVSTKHSGFVINNGSATCQDVLRLIEDVKSVVYSQTGYELECEVKLI